MGSFSYHCALTGKKLINCPVVLLPIAPRTVEHELMECLMYFAPVALPMGGSLGDHGDFTPWWNDNSEYQAPESSDHEQCFIDVEAWWEHRRPDLISSLMRELNGETYDSCLSRVHQFSPEQYRKYQALPDKSASKLSKMIAVLREFERVGRYVMPSMVGPE